MSQIDAFKDTFKCNLCNELLERPIILPCGETICEKDLRTLYNNAEMFQCTLCDEEHQQPKRGFPSNRNVQKMLDLQVNQIDLSKNHPKYDECKKMFREIEKYLKESDLIGKDPENFVFGYFEKILNQVDIQREKLIEEINLYSEKTIETIKKGCRDCLSGYNKMNLISADYETMKENLKKMNQEINSFDINDKKIENLIDYVTKAKSVALTELKRIQDDLLLHKSYKFEPVQAHNINTNNLLGTFSIEVLKYFLKFK